MTVPLPDDLTRLRAVEWNGPHLTIVTMEEREDDCDDPQCTRPHRMLTVRSGRDVEPTPANLARIGEHFLALALGMAGTPLPVPREADPNLVYDSDRVAERLHDALLTNIAGISRTEQDAMQAVAPALARLIYRLAEYVDTAMTGDTAS